MNTERQADEHSHLLPRSHNQDRKRSRLQSIIAEIDGVSIASSQITKEEHALGDTAVGERLPYNDYTTIDWLHDLVKDSFRYRSIRSRKGLRNQILLFWDKIEGWVAAALIGTLTACVAFLVDIAVATVSDWKTGYCKTNMFYSREMCCTRKAPFGAGDPHLVPLAETGTTCRNWNAWTSSRVGEFGVYVAWALLFGIISGAFTMTTRSTLPTASPGKGDKFSSERKYGENGNTDHSQTETHALQPIAAGKSMYLAAGSGIPEIKTILSGFVIPHFLDFKVLLVKAVGSVFAVSTGMCLGKEGPFVHISTCVAYLVGIRFSKYRENSRKLREILAAGCASGLSVAFGAPIGGVLFAYEEISTYFPRKIMWRAFVCSLFAAMTLRELNPTGTGKLVLFETNYGTTYKGYHYIVFVVLGIFGGIFGGTFCKANFLWSRSFRKYDIIKNHPVFEVFLVVAVTALTQYPNPLTREPGDVIIKNLLVDCHDPDNTAYVCLHESGSSTDRKYLGYLIYGTLIKLVLTVITFGIKVPSGIIIPALDAGAFFGRLIGQLPILTSTISPGIFAMVGAGAFLAGVSRMTISLAVIMFELTGELEFIVPNMIGIMVAKWVADWLEPEGVYDLAQTVLGHPFLDLDASMKLVARQQHLVNELIPPEQTMKQITVEVSSEGHVEYSILAKKLEQLKTRGLMDAGLVLVQDEGQLLGYLAEGELEYGLNVLGEDTPSNAQVRVLGLRSALDSAEEIYSFSPHGGGSTPPSRDAESGSGSNTGTARRHSLEGLDLSPFVDRTPLTICATAPMEYVVEMFGKLGLRYLIVTEMGTGRVSGVIIKKRLVSWLDGLKHTEDTW